MARLAVAVTALCACASAFQVPTMSLDKYRSELAETAKKIAAPGTWLSIRACRRAAWIPGSSRWLREAVGMVGQRQGEVWEMCVDRGSLSVAW